MTRVSVRVCLLLLLFFFGFSLQRERGLKKQNRGIGELCLQLVAGVWGFNAREEMRGFDFFNTTSLY